MADTEIAAEQKFLPPVPAQRPDLPPVSEDALERKRMNRVHPMGWTHEALLDRVKRLEEKVFPEENTDG